MDGLRSVGCEFRRVRACPGSRCGRVQWDLLRRGTGVQEGEISLRASDAALTCLLQPGARGREVGWAGDALRQVAAQHEGGSAVPALGRLAEPGLGGDAVLRDAVPAAEQWCR